MARQEASSCKSRSVGGGTGSKSGGAEDSMKHHDEDFGSKAYYTKER
jgi:hypothetical protein